MSNLFTIAPAVKRGASNRFGMNQSEMSSRMSRYPRLGKLISTIFGTTNIGQYARAQVFNNVMDDIPLRDFHSVLDLGCGQGEYSLMLGHRYPHLSITALDIEPDRISKLKKLSGKLGLANLSPHLGEMSTLPDKEHYDLVYSIDVFEHIREDKMPFGEAREKLRPGGLLFVKMPNRDQIEVLPRKWFSAHHAWLEEEHIGQVYTLDDLVDRVQQEGFEVCDAFYRDGWLSRLSWELAYLARKAGAPVHLLFLPLFKLLIHLDRRLSNSSKGNTIQVLARKPH